MPLVRIDLIQGKPAAYRRAIAEAVYKAMVECINVPAKDQFEVISEHPENDLVFDPDYLGIKRTRDIVFIQVTLNAGRTVELKKVFFKRVAELLGDNPGIRPENVLINLVEVPKENWSFGNGVAQYAQ